MSQNSYPSRNRSARPSSFGGRSSGGSSFGGARRSGGGGGYNRSGGGGGRRTFGKQNIHPSKFIKPARVVEAEVYVPTHQFIDFEVNSVLKDNIVAKGYITPSPIQDQAIPLALEGRDVVGIADTGTGKTAAFSIPLLNRLMNDRNARAIVIAPTRELAQQIEVEIRSLSRGAGLFTALLIGGTPMYPQVKALRNRPQIVIGTPGRIKDHFERRNLELSEFGVVVLDEVDRMLDMGFINDIRELLGNLAPVRQCLFFSATMERKIEDLVNTFLKDPVKVAVKKSETSDNVEQDIVHYTGTDTKIDKLHDILMGDKVVKVLVFDDTQRSVDRLHRDLQTRGFMADSLHGGKTQGQRRRALDNFRASKVNILVATDVAARGIDVADITHVINYSTPSSYEDYVHRIGRAGRAGKTGYALTFISK